MTNLFGYLKSVVDPETKLIKQWFIDQKDKELKDFISPLFIKTFNKFNLDSYCDPNEYASGYLVNMFDTKGKKIGTSRGYEEDRDLSIAYYEGAI